MGWRPSTLHDLIVVALVHDGPLTITQLAETITRRYFDWWLVAYDGRWPDSHYGRDDDGEWGTIKRPAPVGYTDLYPRLRAMQGRRVFQDGKATRKHGGSRAGALLWRAVTREDLAKAEEKRRAQMSPEPALRERVESAARAIGCEAQFHVQEFATAIGGRGLERGLQSRVVLKTARGDVEAMGPPARSWEAAAEELGLL